MHNNVIYTIIYVKNMLMHIFPFFLLVLIGTDWYVKNKKLTHRCLPHEVSRARNDVSVKLVIT